MNDWTIAIKSLLYHRRVNLSVMLGVAAATAVLTGALIIGDSMRGSLRSVTLDRLGRIDVIVRSNGFFRAALAQEISAQDGFNDAFSLAVPVMLIPNGTAESRVEPIQRVADVNVLGIEDQFWTLGDDDLRPQEPLADDEVIINQVLANDLNIDQSKIDDGQASITVGISKAKLLPADSALGDKEDLVERIVNLKVVDIVPARSLGRFGLHVSQIPPRNAYLPIKTIQQTLASAGIFPNADQWQQANAILIAGKSDAGVAGQQEIEAFQQNFTPRLSDLGLKLKRVTREFNDRIIFDYYSLSSDRLVISQLGRDSIRKAFPSATELFTYLANEIVQPSEEVGSGIPYSMVTAVDFDDQFQLRSNDGDWIAPLGDDEIVLNGWAADLLGIAIGEQVRIYYFEPETTHGEETERYVDLTVADIAEITTPSEPYQLTRRELIEAVFDRAPTVANDPQLTPEVTGLTDAASMDSWDVPFTMTREIRGPDDDYWNYFRTTPKAFVSLSTGKRLWSSRFGETTSFRIAPENLEPAEIERRLIEQFQADGHLLDMQLVPIKQNGLKASTGATPFDALFLGLSLFVIAAALILVSLLFRLGLQQRAGELGTLLTCGFRQQRVGRIWQMEMLLVCLVGAIAGIFLGLGYAQVMLAALRKWLFDNSTTNFLALHVNWWTLPLGLISGVLICAVTIQFSIRAARKKSVRSLLSGNLESTGVKAGRHVRWIRITVAACVILALGLTILAAVSLAGESQGGAFMAAGFLILAACLLTVWHALRRDSGSSVANRLTLSGIAWTNASRNPLRSTLTVGMVAVASFLIVAISAFRLAPSERGTAEFDYVATTSQAVFADLNSAEGQRSVLRGDIKQLDEASRVFSFRYKSGEDASCNNPYQSTQPRVLGVTRDFVEHFDQPDTASFAFYASKATDEQQEQNPWRLLMDDSAGGSDDGVVPVIIDKNTAWYNLKVYFPGSEFTVDFDSGETVTFRLVALLDNTVLQGSLLIGEDRFREVFPDLSGYRYFLIKSPAPELRAISESLADQGFDARRTEQLLSGFLEVQNTYIATFQSLGALGLLLGTFGLAAVQLRSVVERRRELGLLRAVGFARDRLAQMVLLENAWLLLAGLAVGIGSALFTTLPHYFFGNATIPWLALALMFIVIVGAGLLTGWIASRSIYNAPLIQSLRAQN